MADEGFRALGLTGYRLEITSLGRRRLPARRTGQLLREFLAGLPLDEPTRARAQLNPLRVLDDKRPEVRALLAGRPAAGRPPVGGGGRAPRGRAGPPRRPRAWRYVPNPRMVRGLDYYTKTTFEFVHDGLGAQSGIGGGGRYDGLMAALGGQPLSGVGLRHRRGPHPARLPGRGASRPGRRPAARCSGCRWARRRSAGWWCWPAQLRRAGVRVDLAYGGPRAEGGDEGGRPLRRPLRAGAGGARPRGGHGRGQGPGARGSSSRCRWTGCSTTSSPRWADDAAVTGAGPRPLGRPARRGRRRTCRCRRTRCAVGSRAAARPGGRALDVACGRGAVAVWLALRGFTVDAVDVSRCRAGRRGRAGRAAPGSRTGCGGGRTTSTPGCRPAAPVPYDVVVCQRFRDPAAVSAAGRGGSRPAGCWW